MTLTRDQVLTGLSKTTSLPSFPDVLLRFEEELAKDEPSMSALSKIVENDPALSARFLKLANSAFYTRSKATTSVLGAIQRLGLSEARRLTVATVLISSYGGFGGRDPRLFWVHSVATALTTRVLARLSTAELSEEAIEGAYTAGLLHDLGALALHHLFPDDCSEVYEILEEKGGVAHAVEEELWGISHGEVGELLGEQWKLPTEILKAIRHHHRPWECEEEHRGVVRLVHLANFVCNNQGFGRLESGFPDTFDHSAWESLGLSLAQVPTIIDLAIEEGGRSETLWDLSV